MDIDTAKLRPREKFVVEQMTLGETDSVLAARAGITRTAIVKRRTRMLARLGIPRRPAPVRVRPISLSTCLGL